MAQRFVVQPPPPFDCDQRQPGQAWKKWKQRFNIYLEASDYDSASDKKKISLLLNALGVEGIELYNTFDFKEDGESASSEEGSASQTSLDTVLKRFDEHFQARVNVTFERHLFFMRDQKPGESVDRYVTALRTLASTCELGTLRESLIRDRLVCGLSSAAVKERLLRTSSLTLQKAIDSCRAAEAAKEQVQVIEKPLDDESLGASQVIEKPSYDESVDAVQFSKKNSFQSASEKSPSSDKCGRCGYVHGAKRCPARGKTCNACRGLGHFASVCRTKKTRSGNSSRRCNGPCTVLNLRGLIA